ncbi:MAG TPA: FGGY-family carbohydrate kinase [Hyphomicrobiales bacterium]|jgi:sugar (pentulose or hexulose) kinase
MSSAPPRHIAVIDIGKTNAKVALVDGDRLAEIAVRTRPNTVLTDGPYPHYDVGGHWTFILDALRALNAEAAIDAITVTTHGASAVLIDAAGGIALPALDYEFDGPDALAAEYDAIRPPFSEIGSPRLPAGLNLAAQLFWQARRFPKAFAKVAAILMHPQYWTFRLSGVAANEITSLGAHTDLWNPQARDYSAIVDRLGWRPLFAPIRKASDCLGPIRPDIAAATGLDPATPVYCGIHDSNASLLPHLIARRPPFSVVSTGTWVIAMAIGGVGVTLDPARDTLFNVNAFGDPVASARFMGGREHAILTQELPEKHTAEDVAAVLERQILLMPSVLSGSGPFPDAKADWIAADAPTPSQRRVAVSFYLAMMTAVCLELIGAEGATVAEGPFARNDLYVRMLAAATGRPVLLAAGGGTGTSVGAALLAAQEPTLSQAGDKSVKTGDPLWTAYAREWQARARGRLA